MSGILLLRFYDTHLRWCRCGVSNAEAVARLAFDLRWKVADAHAALELALTASHETEVCAAGLLLTKILCDDVVRDNHGDPQIGRSVVPDRVISVTDPELRHGHKSEFKLFDGRKGQVATEAASELVLAIEPTRTCGGAGVPANRTDGADLQAEVDTVEAQAGATAERVMGDTSYGTADNRVVCAARTIELFSPLPAATDPTVAKTAFHLNLNARSATCPAGHTTTTVHRARDVKPARCSRAACTVKPKAEP